MQVSYQTFDWHLTALSLNRLEINSDLFGQLTCYLMFCDKVTQVKSAYVNCHPRIQNPLIYLMLLWSLLYFQFNFKHQI
nr:hyp [Cotesia vestalis bracovirus]